MELRILIDQSSTMISTVEYKFCIYGKRKSAEGRSQHNYAYDIILSMSFLRRL